MCVERGDSFLQMVCAPGRNHLKPEHLETLLLLATLKLSFKNCDEILKTVMAKSKFSRNDFQIAEHISFSLCFVS